MASSNAQKRYLARPSSPSSDSSSLRHTEDGGRKKQKRDANVYDAVAGCVTTTQAIDDGSDSDIFYQRRSRTTLRDPTLAPEEVLFQRAGAPIRYAEKDIYNAHEQLPDGGRAVLPDSDMLKAVHSYSSRFYSALARSTRHASEGGNQAHRSIDDSSMDETALLAFGILLEEAARDALGKRGDLVFTEGVDVNNKALSDTQPVGFLDAESEKPNSRRGVRKKDAKQEYY